MSDISFYGVHQQKETYAKECKVSPLQDGGLL
jgi:hypothetical protein